MEGYYKAKAEDLQALPCDPVDACPAAAAGEATTCSSKYTGFKCGDCKDRHYRRDRKCQECPETSWGAIVMGVTFVLGCVGLLLLSHPNQVPFTCLSMFLSSIQIMALMPSLPVPWPDNLLDFFQTLSVANFNLELFSPECSVPLTYWEKTRVKLVLPLCAIVMNGVLLILARAFQIIKSNKAAKDRFIYSITIIFLYGYTLLCSASTEPFNCNDDGSGAQYIYRAVNTRCYDDEWQENSFLLYAAIALYVVGIPMGFGFILRNSMNNRTIGSQGFNDRFGVLAIPYRDKFFWFELLNLLRRVSVVLTIDILHGDEHRFYQLFFLIFIIYFMQSRQVCCHPYTLALLTRVVYSMASVPLTIPFEE